MNGSSGINSDNVKKRKPKKIAILGMFFLLLALAGMVALGFCHLHLQHANRAFLGMLENRQEKALANALQKIATWRSGIMERARYISALGIFRRFAQNAHSLSAEELKLNAIEEWRQSSNESLPPLEQLRQIQILLKNFSEHYGWSNAQLLLPDGSPLANPRREISLTPKNADLAREAAKRCSPVFGPIYNGTHGISIDMAMPLLDQYGDPPAVPDAILFLTLPMKQPLTTFLGSGPKTEAAVARIVEADRGLFYMAFLKDGQIKLEPVAEKIQTLANLPFGRRLAFDGKSDVYSLGALIPDLQWLLALELPAAQAQAIIHSQKTTVYAIGILASLCAALLGTWLWLRLHKRRSETEARKYEKLSSAIRKQKMILDSINASFGAGLTLIDSSGHVLLSNQAFACICDSGSEIKPGTPLIEILPETVALRVLEDMSKVSDINRSASDEILININGEDRLFKITLYPYADIDDDKSGVRGCVAVWRDITESRRLALAERRKEEIDRKRQQALISAFARAIESVAPDLVGHSGKMAGVSTLLAEELNLDEDQKKTLELAATLSQIGKIYVPREILNKKGKLTPEELQEIRKAPEYANKILSDLHFDLPVAETVRLIGERVDGSGEPFGLNGNEITICGRALAIVNAFIAMISPRAWRADQTMSIEEAIKTLKADPGFDDKIVAALANLPEEAIANVIKSAS